MTEQELERIVRLARAALGYVRLRVAETEAAMESCQSKTATAKAAPLRATVIAAERALVEEGRRWL